MTDKQTLEQFLIVLNSNGYIGLFEIDDMWNAIHALEKQIPRKPIYSEYDYDVDDDEEILPTKAVCPVCGYEFEYGYWNDYDNHHCVCGQKMDWE